MNPSPEIKRRLYSVKEVAAMLGRSPWTVAEMVRTGQLPYVPAGRRRYVDIKDVERYIENNKVRDCVA